MLMFRLAFLAPAIADFALASLTFHRMLGIGDDSLVPRVQLAGVALCWGILLLYGMNRPVERVWILGPTAMVIGCIAAAYLVGFIAGTVGAGTLVFTQLICATMIWLCWTALRRVRNLKDGGAA